MAEITVPRHPNPWRPADFGPLRLSENLSWRATGRLVPVTVRVMYVTRMVPHER